MTNSKVLPNDRIVVYQTFSDPVNAHIVKGLLDSNGINCFISDENIVSVNPLYSQAVGGVKLNVFERDIPRINSLLNAGITSEETEATDKTNSSIVCPNCNSHNVAYGGSVKQKFGLWNMILPFLLMVYPFTMRKAYHCFNCDHEFKKS
ncbi:MAG: DUF2007 domain-containing protein [Candidatus Saccharibacteria bacterium]